MFKFRDMSHCGQPKPAPDFPLAIFGRDQCNGDLQWPECCVFLRLQPNFLSIAVWIGQQYAKQPAAILP